MSPRRSCRKDLNHDEIANAFRKLGWHVLDTYQIGQLIPGFPDLMMCLKCRPGVGALVEVKAPGGKLTPAEAEFHESWPGPIMIVSSVDEAIAITEKWR